MYVHNANVHLQFVNIHLHFVNLQKFYAKWHEQNTKSQKFYVFRKMIIDG